MTRYVSRRHTIASLGIGSIFLAGCLGDSDDAEDSGGDDPSAGSDGDPSREDGGTLHVSQNSERAEEFDPVISNGAYSTQVWNNIFDRLYSWDDAAGLEPKVAAGHPEIERDETRFIFEIQDGIEFHNGDEMTAADVVHSFLAPVEEQTDVMPEHEMIESAEAIDEYSLQVDLEYPSGHFTSNTMGVPIVPEDIRTEDREEFNENPVGSGPFEWHDFVYNEYVEIVRNDDYWDAPLPNLEMVRYEAMQDSASRIASLRAGDTDIIFEPPDADWDVLEGEGNIGIKTADSFGFHYLGFHCGAEYTSNPDVRRAICHSISLPDFIDRELPRSGHEMTDPFGPTINEEWDFPADTWEEQYPEYDPDLAQELFDENVPSDWSPMIITTPGIRADLAEEVQLRVREFGYEMDIQILDLLPLVERINEGDPDDYQMFMFGTTGGPDPDEYIYEYLHESLEHESISTFYEGSNGFHDNIIEARRSVDQDHRRELYIDIVDELLENLPMIPAFGTLHTAAALDTVRDFNLSPNVFINPRLVSDYGNIWVEG